MKHGKSLVSTGMRLTISALAFGFWALQTYATEYEWVPGSTSWADPASYTNKAVAEVNTTMPGSSDDVDIPANCTATLNCDNADDLAAVNNIGRIRPMTASSYFVVNVPGENDEVTLMTKVNYDNTANYAAWSKGGLEKRGAGTLILGVSSGNFTYFTDITVAEGTLKLPQETEGSWRYFDVIAVSNGATLFICDKSNNAGGALTGAMGLVGQGVVTNDASAVCFLEILGSGRVWSHRFDGVLSGKIQLNNPRTRFDLTNPNNTFSGGVRAMREYGYTYGESIIGLMKIGNQADAASSAGKYDTSYGLGYRDTRAWNRHYGAGFMYLGAGETTDKDIYVNASNYNTTRLLEDPNFFDGGPNGGLTLAGEFKIVDTYNQVFVLTGSNVNECVVAGPLKNKVDNGTNYSWRIVKKGTGAWRFADVSNTEMTGVFAVENGSLRYDSIAEAGTRCSLGYSTQLLENYIGKIDDNRRVDYAFELGSTTDASADPVFEYTGSAKGWCFSRPMALKGNARLRHSGGAELRLSTLKTLNAAAKTLTLDGEGNEAWLFNVTDQYGTLSLVKDGSGTWTVAGTNQISGSVAVKGGTLNLRHHEAPYTWFRWTHKQTLGNWLTCNIELGIYDVNGSRINSGLTYNSTRVVNAESAKNLEAGEVAIADTGTFNETYGSISTVANLFDNTVATHWETAHYPQGESTWRQAKANDPTSWFSLVMRLPENTPRADSYDFIAWGNWSYRSNEASRVSAIYGSIDGINWKELDDYDRGGISQGGKATTWSFGHETYGNGDAACKPADLMTHTTGRKIAGYPAGLPVLLANVTNISVASGARFAVTGGTLDLPSGITLTVDGATGAGTIANMNLPASGTLDIVNMPSFFGVAEIPVTFENVEGVDNLAGWTLKVNGAVTLPNRMRAKVYGNNIILAKRGIAISIR